MLILSMNLMIVSFSLPVAIILRMFEPNLLGSMTEEEGKKLVKE